MGTLGSCHADRCCEWPCSVLLQPRKAGAARCLPPAACHAGCQGHRPPLFADALWRVLGVCPQGDDDLHSLLHDLSSSPTLPESTALIWGSSEEVGADARPGSSCSGSILQPDSPMGDSQVRRGGHSQLPLWMQLSGYAVCVRSDGGG